MNRSRASGTACGSVFSRFCALSWNRVPALVPVAHCPLPIVWPGGMHGAFESAALVVDKRWRVEPKPKATSSNLKSADL